MKLALQIEGMFGLTWARWHRLVTEIERLGFAGLFRSDHFTLTEPPDLDALEAMVSLTYLAVHTQECILAHWSRRSLSATRSCWRARRWRWTI